MFNNNSIVLKNWKPCLGAGLLVLLALFFYLPTFNKLPNGTHGWAQSDRLALAMGFQKNGYNFFLPTTLNIENGTGICGTELPLPAFLAAMLSWLLRGILSVSLCFKLLNLGVVIWAMWLVFSWVLRRTHHLLLALLPTVFLFSSVTFVSYTCNYLSDSTALACTLIAICFLFFALENPLQTRFWGYSLMAAWLAAMLKMSIFPCFLVISAALLWQLFIQKNNKKIILKYVTFVLTGIVLYAVQFWYMNYLNQTYDSSIFLAATRPLPFDWKQFYKHSEAVFEQHWYRYFTSFSLPLFSVSIILFLLIGSLQYRRYSFELLFFGGMFAGCFTSYFMMGSQYMVHDYYAISSLLLIATLAIIFAAIVVGECSKSMIFSTFFRGSLTLILLFLSYKSLTLTKENYIDRVLGEMAKKEPDFWLTNEAVIDTKNIGIPSGAPIFFIGSIAPNYFLVYFDLRGLGCPTKEFIAHAASFEQNMNALNISYVVISKSDFEQLKNNKLPFCDKITIAFTGNNYLVLKR